MKFDNLSDIKHFAKDLADCLLKAGYTEKSKKVLEFSYNSFTTSSEYLGEFRIMLHNLKKENLNIDKEVKTNISDAINSINIAFGNTI